MSPVLTVVAVNGVNGADGMGPALFTMFGMLASLALICCLFNARFTEWSFSKPAGLVIGSALVGVFGFAGLATFITLKFVS